jgi:hypothetical protein
MQRRQHLSPAVGRNSSTSRRSPHESAHRSAAESSRHRRPNSPNTELRLSLYRASSPAETPPQVPLPSPATCFPAAHDRRAQLPPSPLPGVAVALPAAVRSYLGNTGTAFPQKHQPEPQPGSWSNALCPHSAKPEWWLPESPARSLQNEPEPVISAVPAPTRWCDSNANS